MTDVSLTAGLPLSEQPSDRPKLDVGSDARTALLFVGLLALALFFVAYSVSRDIVASGVHVATWLPYLLLGVALFIALGFEFVNGLHDTANAVATVIYTHSLRRFAKERPVSLPKSDADILNVYRAELDRATRFIPTWVKVAVALALGLGTMVGWKRVVVTVGEKIGKSHLTYAQGASAELVAAATIAAADIYGLPVSTTQVLSSGVAGSMAASRSGLQMATVRNVAVAWVDVKVAIATSGTASGSPDMFQDEERVKNALVR